MALVAYGSSGDSDSDYEDESPVPTLPKSTPKSIPEPVQTISADVSTTTEPKSDNAFAFNLPTPKASHNTAASNNAIIEEDDEFLRKKPVAQSTERPPPPPKPLPRASGPVKIVLPALASFAEHKSKEKPQIGAQLPSNKPTGLIDMLPKPKSMQFGQKTSTAAGKASTALVPDSISRPKKPTAAQPPKRPAVSKTAAAAAASSTSAATAKSDSDDSDAEDFFSFNAAADDQLPEVSAAEIAAMVASQAAKMDKSVKNRQLQQNEDEAAAAAAADPANAAAIAGASHAGPSSSNSGAIDQSAIAALLGSRRAKRARHAAAEMSNIIDISGDQVLPDRDAWMRTQLTATTEYQPRGLVDADPGAGTKRKHQITYLAHQAKVNEQELQAMWAANRQTRQQTQNKYGF